MLLLLALACAPKQPAAPPPPPPAPAATLQDGALSGATPLQRGTYLTSAVVDCVHCHTKRDVNDWTKEEGPPFAGGEVFDAAWQIPGTIITPNLTPDMETGLGAWTDLEVKRAIREGLNRSGERLFPLMPSHYFQAMSDEDLDGIVAFLRALPPTPKASTEVTTLKIPRDALPKLPPITAAVPPSPTDPVGRGAYLVRLANCRTCHSPTKGGQEIQDRFLAGGVYFTTPFGSFPTPNLTPDPETGLGAWTDDEIKTLLTTGVRKNGQQVIANFMPWWLYRNLAPSDLDAIVAYLRSLPPVKSNIYLPENQFALGG
jgi:mono/diheme cytochrome c family protein